MASKAQRAKASKVMKEFSKGKLRSGSAKGPKVKNPAQAKAIAMSESGQSYGDKAARRKRLEGKPL